MALTILVVCTIAIFSLYVWDLALSLAGLFAVPMPNTNDKRQRTFALLICAHNEEANIAEVIQSLIGQDYPLENFRIFVVADNCEDETADIARREGATVFERHDLEKRAKGYGLQFGLQKLLQHEPFDAVCIFGADNFVASDFLQVMNIYLAEGELAIQAYLDSANPSQSWVTRCITLASSIHRFGLRARARLGLATTLGRAGFCLDWELAEKHRWDPASRAGHLDLSMRLAWAGVRITYCPHTRTYEEKPATLRPLLWQLSRRMPGHSDVAFHWSFRLLGGLFVRPLFRPALSCFNALLHLTGPARALLALLLLIAIGVATLIAQPELEAHWNDGGREVEVLRAP